MCSAAPRVLHSFPTRRSSDLDQKIGPGDRFITEDLAELRRGRRGPKVIAIVTKTDLVGRDVLAEHLVAVDRLLDRSEERRVVKGCRTLTSPATPRCE